MHYAYMRLGEDNVYLFMNNDSKLLLLPIIITCKA